MLYPSRKLLEHEWAKHGTCSGLGADGYLEASDKALGAVSIPEQLQPLSTTHYFTAADITRMFRQSNPQIPADGIVVICNGPQLSEVRVCMDKDLAFASCGKGVKTQCRAGDIRVPPLR
ncbi:Ribonuclease T2 family protein [compost metagenome]